MHACLRCLHLTRPSRGGHTGGGGRSLHRVIPPVHERCSALPLPRPSPPYPCSCSRSMAPGLTLASIEVSGRSERQIHRGRERAPRTDRERPSWGLPTATPRHLDVRAHASDTARYWDGDAPPQRVDRAMVRPMWSLSALPECADNSRTGIPGSGNRGASLVLQGGSSPL